MRLSDRISHPLSWPKKSMIFPFKSLPVSTLVFNGPSVAANEPEIHLVGNTLYWSAIDAISINVYRENGEFIESIPGNATQWQAPALGGYFLVGADHGDWQTGGKSNTVHVYDECVQQWVAN